MSAEELGHAEGLDLLLAEDRLHHLVRGEPLLVLRVLGRKNINLKTNNLKRENAKFWHPLEDINFCIKYSKYINERI